MARYNLNFGSANAAGVPTFSVFRFTDTLAAATQPSIVNDGGGWFHFDYSFADATVDSGWRSVEYTAVCNGIELADVLTGVAPASVPAVTSPSSLVGNYTTATLLDDIRKIGMLPDASTLSFDDVSLLRIADRELQAGLVPLILSAREEYFVVHLDQNFTPPAIGQTLSFRTPYRAIGGKLRDVCLLSPNGAQIRVPQIGLDGLEQGNTGWYMEGSLVVIYSPFGNWQANTIRMSYYLRRNQLVTTDKAAIISGINPGASTITLSGSVAGGAIPATFSAATSFDLVKALPGYDTLAFDQASTLVGSTLTFASLPTELALGDYVALAQQTPVPQIPPDLHPALAQRVVCKALEAIGDMPGLQAAQAKLADLERTALELITPRVDGEPKRIANRNSPFRRRRRMLLY